MRRTMAVIAALFLTAALTGCGGDTEAQNTGSGVKLQKNGKIVQTIAEEFAEDYYSAEELKEQAQQEAEAYNQLNGSGSVKVGSVKAEDGTVQMDLTFADSLDYASFNHVTFFAGKASEAAESGYSLDVTVKSADGSASAGQEELLAEDYHIVITEEAGVLQTYGDILFASDNVVLNGEREAQVKESDALAYVVFR